MENECEKRTALFESKSKLPHLFSVMFKTRKKLKIKCYYCGRVATQKEQEKQIGSVNNNDK